MFKEVYALYEGGIFNKWEVITIPVRAFFNENTGEIKLFAKTYVEKEGETSIIKKLSS